MAKGRVPGPAGMNPLMASDTIHTDRTQFPTPGPLGMNPPSPIADSLSVDGIAELKTWDKVSNKRVVSLDPKIQKAAVDFINEVDSKLGIKLRISQALRTDAEQNALYAQGRTSPGKIVTNAKGGESYHNYGLAIDVVEIKDGKAVWNTNWSAISKIGISHGFSWGGNWSTPDRPHFQIDFGLSIKQLQQGQRP